MFTIYSTSHYATMMFRSNTQVQYTVSRLQKTNNMMRCCRLNYNYTQTHTHTHIYVYIYLYIYIAYHHSLSCV